MCNPSASTHLSVTRLVVFISLCSACGRKISTFKLTKHERCFTQLMSGIYGLCSHETMWGIIPIICTVNRDWEHDTLVRFSFSVYLREIIFVYLSNITPFWLSVFPWPPALDVLLMFTESSVVSGHQTVLPTLRPMQNISGLSERTVLLAYECNRDAKPVLLGKIVGIHSCIHNFMQIRELYFTFLLSTTLIMPLHWCLNFHKLSCSYSSHFKNWVYVSIYIG